MVPVCDKRIHIYNRFRHFWAEIKKLWNYPLVDCPSHEKHESKCPTNKDDFTVFAACCLQVYIQRRARCSVGLLIGPLVQVAMTLMAWYTCLSRVMNNKHHPSDVIAGAIIGAVTALTVVGSSFGINRVPLMH